MNEYMKRHMPALGLMIDYAESFDGWEKHLGEDFVVLGRGDWSTISVMNLRRAPDKFGKLEFYSEARGTRLATAEAHRIILYGDVPGLIHRALLEVETIKRRILLKSEDIQKHAWQNCQEKEQLRTLIDSLFYSHGSSHVPGFGYKKEVVRAQALDAVYPGYKKGDPVEIVSNTSIHGEKLPKGSRGTVVDGGLGSVRIHWPDIDRTYTFNEWMFRRCW